MDWIGNSEILFEKRERTMTLFRSGFISPPRLSFRLQNEYSDVPVKHSQRWRPSDVMSRLSETDSSSVRIARPGILGSRRWLRLVAAVNAVIRTRSLLFSWRSGRTREQRRRTLAYYRIRRCLRGKYHQTARFLGRALSITQRSPIRILPGVTMSDRMSLRLASDWLVLVFFLVLLFEV